MKHVLCLDLFRHVMCMFVVVSSRTGDRPVVVGGWCWEPGTVCVRSRVRE